MKRIILITAIILFFSFPAIAKDFPVKQIQRSVTVTAAAADISPINLKGRYVLIQNNDAAGVVYINLSGDATVSTTMFRLNPGDSLELFNITNAISAIGSIPSNANVAISEGI
ncbi:MAG: hypothetical protein H8E41_12405 [Desulfobulbaceae bacterium]|uniref:Uncharacterized protein n=1 Tax=Candidatus Desulfobia pelagia TaxID=2841692 RepID=A0A8J6TGF8_9BACT|nr:hypothetical protein [Candidatus Desulfobia pelagia]